MEPIYDRHGKVVAWRRKEAVHDLDGKPRAFMWGRGLHRFDGELIGRYEDGFYRDLGGSAVGFLEGATGAPLPPHTEPPPVAPPHILHPPLPRVNGVSIPTFRSARWSDLDWQTFVGAGRP